MEEFEGGGHFGVTFCAFCVPETGLATTAAKILYTFPPGADGEDLGRKSLPYQTASKFLF